MSRRIYGEAGMVRPNSPPRELVDPVSLLIEKAAAHNPHPQTSLAAMIVTDDLPFEVPMTPPAGARVMRLSVGGTYRQAVPVIFDPTTRTTYPLPADR